MRDAYSVLKIHIGGLASRAGCPDSWTPHSEQVGGNMRCLLSGFTRQQPWKLLESQEMEKWLYAKVGISLVCCLNLSFMNCWFSFSSTSLAPNPDLLLTESIDCKRCLQKGLKMFPNFSVGAHTECLLDIRSSWTAELGLSSLGQG